MDHAHAHEHSHLQPRQAREHPAGMAGAMHAGHDAFSLHPFATLGKRVVLGNVMNLWRRECPLVGTFETWQPILRISVDGARPEVMA